jgi:hypothetical protein
MRRWLRSMSVPEPSTAGFATAVLGIWSPSASVNFSALPRCGRSSSIGGLAGLLQRGVPPANRLGRLRDALAKGSALTGTIHHWELAKSNPSQENKPMNATESNVQLQIRMPSSMRQAVKIEAAMREVRVCRFVQEAIKEKIARDRACERAGTDPAA